MSQKFKRICKCCGKEYEYCPHCGSHSDELWKNITDTLECREVLNIVSAYNIGKATKEQVKKVLDKYGVTDYGKYKDSISSVLNSLFGEAPKEEHKEEVNVAPVIERVAEPVAIPEPEQPEVVQTFNEQLNAVLSSEDKNEANESIVKHEEIEAPKPTEGRHKRRKKYRHMDVDSN